MKRFGTVSLLLVAGSLGLAGCAGDASSPSEAAPSAPRSAASKTGRFLIIGEGGALPADLAAQVAAAGGTLEHTYPQIGVAIATSSTLGFGASISGVQSVTEDIVIEYQAPARTEELAADAAAPATPLVASLADNEPFYPIQWAPAAVSAPEAWNAGYTGAGVRVAILDGGLYRNHADLAAGVDAAASRSFAPGAYNTDTGTFWHGTHVAGIVGARDNGVGVIGIAPNATLIGVKVLHNGSGSFAWLLNGIMYAATPQAEGGAGAQVINMSLGATVDGKDHSIKHDVKELVKAIDLATRYAYERGVVVVASAGNGATNFDDAKTLVKLPASNAHVISVSATAPLAWAYGNTNFSRLASYSDHGKSLVDVAAPGGDFAHPTNENCTVNAITRACWVFDMYLSTSRGTTAAGSYSWAAGTSMAAPVVSGIAALIIQANGGSMHPAQVKAKLMQGAADLGKPGNDEFYGAGWVNAWGSVQ